jgi:hypothetical protein
MYPPAVSRTYHAPWSTRPSFCTPGCAGSLVHHPEGGASSSAPASAAAAAAPADAAGRVKKWRTRAEAQMLALDMVGLLCRSQASIWTGFFSPLPAGSPAVAATLPLPCYPTHPPAGRHPAGQPLARAALLGPGHQGGPGAGGHSVPGHRQGASRRHPRHGGGGAGRGGPGGQQQGTRRLPARWAGPGVERARGAISCRDQERRVVYLGAMQRSFNWSM